MTRARWKRMAVRAGGARAADDSSQAPTALSQTRYGSARPRCRTSVPTLPLVSATVTRRDQRVREQQAGDERVAAEREHDADGNSATRMYQTICSGR